MGRPSDVFAPVALSHICHQVADLVAARVNQQTVIELNTSAQPNSNPHLGTVTTIFSTFALAEHLQAQIGLPVRVTFDYLENACGEIEKVGDMTFQRSLADAGDETGKVKLHRYLPEFERLVSFAASRTGVVANMRSYREFQSAPEVRGLLLQLLNRKAEFEPILGLHEPNIHIRFPCPVCGKVDKEAASLKIERIDLESAVLSMVCPMHGIHTVMLGAESDSYLDTGTAVRDIVKMAALGIQASKTESIAVMLDGTDWGGAWAWNVSALGATMLGVPYAELPIRYFSPAILDANGSKFSKSVFVSSDTYDYLPREYLDSKKMHEKSGDRIFERLLSITRTWVSEPARFFRNYSIEYIASEIGHI